MKVLVTGVTAGIGKDLFLLLLQQGHTVWGLSRSQLNFTPTGTYHFDNLDLADEDRVEDFLLKLSAQNFIPDVIIYNAAIYDNDSVKLDGAAFYNQVSAINVRSIIQIANKFTNGTTRHIYISSISAMVIDWDNIFYHTTKHTTTQYFNYLKVVHKQPVKQFYLGAVNTGIKKNKNLKTVSGRAKPEDVAAYIVKNIGGKRTRFYFPYYYRFIALFFNFFSLKMQYRLFNFVKK